MFLPGKSHVQRGLVGYSPWGPKRVGHDLGTKWQQSSWERWSIDLECDVAHSSLSRTSILYISTQKVCFKCKSFFNVSSVQFSRPVMSDSLWPHESQHARPPCPSPTPRVYPNSCPLSQWCHPTISSSVVPFSSCPQSFPASGSFHTSQLFTSGGQSIGVVSFNISPSNEHPVSFKYLINCSN